MGRGRDGTAFKVWVLGPFQAHNSLAWAPSVTLSCFRHEPTGPCGQAGKVAKPAAIFDHRNFFLQWSTTTIETHKVKVLRIMAIE